MRCTKKEPYWVAKRERSMGSELHVFPEDILIDVLKRLPAKTLMRFKSVSKSWHRLICDPYFTESHHICSHSRPEASYLMFFLVTRTFDVLSIFPTNSDGTPSAQLPVHNLCTFIPCTNIVNGLICLYDSYTDILHMLNVTTGEIIALPTEKPFLVTRSLQFFKSPLFLGFDPVTKKYKLLYIHRDKKTKIIEECYILTLGTGSWRAIDCPKFVRFGKRATSINGAIYWKLSSRQSFMHYFDVGEEKFKLLAAPDGFGGEIVIQVGRNLAFLCLQWNYNQFHGTMWRLNSDNQVWVKDEKYSFSPRRRFRAVGTTNTGEIMLTNQEQRPSSWYSWANMRPTLLILYDLVTGKHSETEITLPVPEDGTLSVFGEAVASHHVENIIHLETLIRERTAEQDESVCNCYSVGTNKSL